MWSFLKKTYSHATNVVKILQLEEELCNIRQGDQDLSQYFATLTAAYERLKALRPPCKHCYASHFETGMVEKFLSRLSSEFSVAKSQILTGSDLPDLADTYNRLSRLVVTLSQPTHDTPVSTLVISGGRGHSSFAGTRGRGTGRGAGRGRFQCSYCGKLGHGGGRTIIGKGPSSSNAPFSQAITSMVESPTSAPSYSLNLSKEEYDLVLAQRSSPASTSTAAVESACTVGAPTTDPGMVWMIDSGASRHCCNQPHMFLSLTRFTTPQHVRLADGKLSPILGSGDIYLTSLGTITHVLYASKFPINLLFVKQLARDLQCRVIFYPGSCSFQDLQTGKTIGGGHEREGLYFLSTPVNVAASSFTSKPTPLQWHLRLGHPSVSKLRRMFPDIPASEFFLCEACQLGKHTCSSFTSSQSPSSKSPFDLLHVDVWGPS
ncbi:hypothetical protein EJ110_NYTH60163 [Nymphaea thermarum]|nr:hypothetical protein EJ110_NYTH60163 [Nymphaea thermarum]